MGDKSCHAGSRPREWNRRRCAQWRYARSSGVGSMRRGWSSGSDGRLELRVVGNSGRDRLRQ
eukprot:2885077-Pyramimonas_sp.AAC.1